MRNILFAAIAALTLGVGSASAYAAQVDFLQNLQNHSQPAYDQYQVNWLQDHSRPAYQDDSAAT